MEELKVTKELKATEEFMGEYYVANAFKFLKNFLDFGRRDIYLLKDAEKYIHKALGIYENIEFRKHFEHGENKNE